MEPVGGVVVVVEPVGVVGLVAVLAEDVLVIVVLAVGVVLGNCALLLEADWLEDEPPLLVGVDGGRKAPAAAIC